MSSQKVESNSSELQNQRQLEISVESSSLTNKLSFSNQNYSKNEKKQNIDKKSSVSDDHPFNGKERRRIKSEFWDFEEIRTIFNLYEEYGSQWKIMEAEFIDRAANSIKNRFYTVIRSLLKILFREHPSIIEKLPHEIPSKTILKFYEGREGTMFIYIEFNKFKGFGKKILKMLDYNLESKEMKQVVEENSTEIIIIYEMIFDLKSLDAENLSKKKTVFKKFNSEPNIQYEEMQKNEKIIVSPKSSPGDFMKTTADYNDCLVDQGLNMQGYEGFAFLLPIANYEGYQVYPYLNYY